MANKLLIQFFAIVTLSVCAQSINVTHSDLHHEATSLKHVTNRFESHRVDLYVRRGATFDVSFTFDNVTGDDLPQLSLQLMFNWSGAEFLPIHSKRDLIDSEHTWSSSIIEKTIQGSEANVTFSISVPLKAAVGEYALQVKEESQIIWDSRLMEGSALYVLFNPYHPEEQVYMNDKRHLQEYLESDLGAVYTGGAFGAHWIFGQYTSTVFKTLMKLLNIHYDPSSQIYINYTMRTDPVLLSRTVADIMHNVDSDHGLMQGRWDGYYSDGVDPSMWTSSVPIYEQYSHTNRTVKYAQCWVFAAVATTALRALGLPSRPITTYDAAHNTRDDLMVHRCTSSDLDRTDYAFCNSDSVWNFHSWTEAWMTRSDLCDEANHCPSFAGWQVVDATPQEPSIHDDTYAVGPSAKTALFSGDVLSNYDSSFVFSEVAAPVITWRVHNHSVLYPIKVELKAVGSSIVTKKLNSKSTEFEDITHTYKNRDLEWHRVTLIKAFHEKGVNMELIGHNLTLEPIIEMKVDMKPRIVIGEPIEFNVTLKNNDHGNQSVRYSLQLNSVFYTGIVSSNVINQEFTRVLQPNETVSHSVVVPFDSYYLRLVDTMHLNLISRLHAKESDYVDYNQHDFVLRTPDVILKNHTEVVDKKRLTLSVSFKNTLPFELSHCFMKIDGLRNFLQVRLPDIRVNEEILKEITVIYDSSPAVFATIDCLELENIRGSLRLK